MLSFEIFFIWLNSPSPQCTSLLPMQLCSWKQSTNFFLLPQAGCVGDQPLHTHATKTRSQCIDWRVRVHREWKIPPVCLTHPHVHGHGLVVNKLYWKQLSYDHVPNSLIMAPGHVTAFRTSTSHNQYRPLNSVYVRVFQFFFSPHFFLRCVVSVAVGVVHPGLASEKSNTTIGKTHYWLVTLNVCI